MTDLVGEYRHKLDIKGRISLPSDFRKILSKDLKVSLAPGDECLYVFEPEEFSAWVSSLFEADGGYKASNKVHVAMRTKLNSRARNVEVDGSGRIGITAEHRAAAGLDKEVVLIGNTDHLEIWDAKRWDDFCNSIDLTDLFSE